MDSLESAKLEKIGRQAMNIQMIEAVFKQVDSDGEPIEGTERPRMFLYNLEKISAEEVEKILNHGDYMFEPRILEADPERVLNIFPHAGESKKEFGPSFWEPVRGCTEDICRCSACGMEVSTDNAVVRESGAYKAVKYRFCPKCGSVMSVRKETEDGQD